MSEEELIISVYCLVDEKYKEIVGNGSLRKRGPDPALRDAEVLTMLIVGEYLGLGSDKGIWAYFCRHYKAWFPKLGHRTAFTRQSANLYGIFNTMQEFFGKILNQDNDLYLFDGFPIPTCHIKRYKRSRLFKEEGGVGYCAAKDMKYFGFKGHLLMTPQGVTKCISIASAQIDERDVLPEVVEGLTGDIIADKGLIRPELKESLEKQGLFLHTPLRKNMKDTRPKALVHQMMNVRRRIETVIGQLTDRFKIQKIRAKDTWHLLCKIRRKILAHTVSFFLNQKINPDTPLQLEKLLAY